MTTMSRTADAALRKISDPRRSALIVIDMQNDFCAKGGYFDRTGADLTGMEELADRLNCFIGTARVAGALVIFVRSLYDPIYLSDAQKERRRRVGWDLPLCRAGTWGFEFYRVEPQDGDPIVTKHRFDAFYNTDLELILNTNNRRNLFFAGVSTNVCVETSLRNAFTRDFEVVLLADCTAARNRRAHEATLDTVHHHFGLVATSQDAERVWGEMAVP
jgi:ureidoacrylate peracid hydrolase